MELAFALQENSLLIAVLSFCSYNPSTSEML